MTDCRSLMSYKSEQTKDQLKNCICNHNVCLSVVLFIYLYVFKFVQCFHINVYIIKEELVEKI